MVIHHPASKAMLGECISATVALSYICSPRRKSPAKSHGGVCMDAGGTRWDVSGEARSKAPSLGTFCRVQ